MKTQHEGNPTPNTSKTPALGLAGVHIRKTLREITDGVTARLKTIREAVVTEPAEDIAWELSARLNRVKANLFDKVDHKIDRMLAKKKKAGSHALAVERFDDEGGAMMPTQSSN